MRTICNHKGYNSSIMRDLRHEKITVIDQEKSKEKIYEKDWNSLHFFL